MSPKGLKLGKHMVKEAIATADRSMAKFSLVRMSDVALECTAPSHRSEIRIVNRHGESFGMFCLCEPANCRAPGELLCCAACRAGVLRSGNDDNGTIGKPRHSFASPKAGVAMRHWQDNLISVDQ
jgi:hypothetical protein